jgi:hypothetical protein
MYDDRDIDFSDIPEITDLSGFVRHPLAGKFKGKYNVLVHYDFTDGDDIDEVIETATARITIGTDTPNLPPVAPG